MYLLDANIMIEAKNRYYAFDIAPGFWSWLESCHSRGRVFSTMLVRDEMYQGQDELAQWSRNRPRDFFIAAGSGTAPHLRSLAQWVTRSGQYTDSAKATFLDSADYYLVAQAREHGYGLVTHETPSQSRRRVKIPEAARHLGVTILSPFEVMRAEGARLS